MLPSLDSPISKKIGVVTFTTVINELVKIYKLHEQKSNFISQQEVFKNIFVGLV